VTYTQLALVAVVASVALDVAVLRTGLVRRRAFWVPYLIVLGFQLITNGILTGTRIVRYDGAAIIGSSTGSTTPAFLGDGRIAWAPVEDLLFGFSLVLQTLAWWVFWGRHLSRASGLDQGGAGDREAAA
jgi:lycopene cyclase domain-containing protein